MLGVIMLNVLVLSVMMLDVVAPYEGARKQFVTVSFHHKTTYCKAQCYKTFFICNLLMFVIS